MSWPTSTSTPRRWRTSRLSAAASVSDSSTPPPGNSQSSGSTAAGRRCVMRYRPSRSTTAATTRIVRCDDSIQVLPPSLLGRARAPSKSHLDTEQLLAHQEDVAGRHLGLALEPDEAAVRAAEVRQAHLPVLRREPAVQARDVPVLGEEHVAALAPEVQARLRDGEGVARDVASDDERDA